MTLKELLKELNSLDIEKYGNCDVCRPTRNWDGDVIHSICITPRVNDITGKEDKVIFGGRLAEYKYYDMDDVIKSAFETYKNS